VGREHELAILADRVAQAGRGQGQVVGIVGEPGVGKSRLVYELARSDGLRHWRVAKARAIAYGVAIPFQPIAELVRDLLSLDSAATAPDVRRRLAETMLREDPARDGDVAALCALLQLSVDPPDWETLGPPLRRRRVIDAVMRVLLEACLVRPLAVIVEDLHWSDHETQAILDVLVGSVPTARLLLVLTYRPELEHPWSRKTYYSQHRLDPLPPAAASLLLEDLMGSGSAVDPLKRHLLDTTGDNPLFLEEYVRALRESGALGGGAGEHGRTRMSTPLEVPATVQAVLLVRINRRPDGVRAVLQTAAVIGKDVPFVVLRASAGLTEEVLQQHLAQLRDGEFLYEVLPTPERGLRFKHVLTREAAYATLLPEQRRELHRRVVAAMEGLYADRLSDHVERLGDQTYLGELWEKAVRYVRQAGLKALDRGASREAAAALAQALRALGQLPGRCRDRELDARSVGEVLRWPHGVSARRLPTFRRGLDGSARVARRGSRRISSGRFASDERRANLGDGPCIVWTICPG